MATTTRGRNLLFWFGVGGLALAVAVTLPVLGLQLTSREASKVAEIVAVKSAGEELDAAVNDFAVKVRLYELSGSAPEKRSSAKYLEVDPALERIRLAAERLAQTGAARYGLDDNVDAVVAAEVRYVRINRQRAEALASGGDSPQLALEATTVRTAMMGISSAFSAEGRLALDAQLQNLAGARHESLALSLASAAVLLTAFAGLGLRETRTFRRRLMVSDSRAVAAETAADERAQMVNLASHELRNPLTIVSASAQVLEKEAEARGDADLVETARDARAAAMRADALITELLDLNRLDANRLDLRIVPTTLTPMIIQALSVTENHRGVRPIETPAESAGAAAVMADPIRLSIILRNLIDNAFKYSPADSPLVVSISEEGQRTAVDVRDAGSGVAAADSEAVFVRFNRLRATEHIGGIGIGLYLSRELARRMGGDIESLPNAGGGHFRLTLRSAGSASLHTGAVHA
ncbi:MAG: HAMP domain-containing sensor histidine kinase [Tepidiformaceae bacterium]